VSDANEPEADPILEQRARIRVHANKASRVGYLCYGVATVLFFVGLFTSFSGTLVTAIVGLLIVGSIVLAVAIQVSYAIRGAERWEEDGHAQRRRR
jgi:multisubunit Na+/H+ antiporter MnhG subunit